ncbi:MAG: VanW family protein [Actinobacteria bacterium]|nr:VanW family protein [Actinomycetota bacterium]
MAVEFFDRILRGGWRARLIAAFAALVAVVVLAILVDAGISYNRVHPGVSVAGVGMGRMTPEAAEEALTRKVERARNNSVTLTADTGREWYLLPSDVDVQVDAAATAKEAMAVTRTGSFFADLRTKFRLYFSGTDVPLSATLDTALLDEVLLEVTNTLDVAPVNAGLVIRGDDIEIVDGKDGLVVDEDALRDGVKELLFTLSAGRIDIAMVTEAPAIQAADTSEAVAKARTMLHGSVGLSFEDVVWALSPSEIASAMDFTTEGEGPQSKLVPYLSHDKLAGFLETVAVAVAREPKKATWETNGETATLIAGSPGLALDPEKTAQELTLAALSPDSRVAKVQAVETQPSRTTEQAKAMGIVSKLAGYTTEFGGSDGRRKNVQRAAELINGTLLAPGEEFDFDRVVGQRTTANGFTTAPAIIAGKLEDSLGGGICQVSTTLFNAVFFAGLDVTARTNHSLYISHYPTGRDATVSWGGPAFRFKNDTSNWVLIKSAASWSSLTFVVYGTPVGRSVTYTTGDWYGITSPTEKRVKTAELFEGATRVVDDGQTGRKIKVTRTVVENGTTVHSDSFVSSYPMKPKVIEEGTKPTTTTTVAPPSTMTTKPPASSTTTTSTTTSTTTTP